MLKKNTELPILKRVFELMDDSQVHQEAEELAKHANKNGRSVQEVQQNAIPSLAVQYAVFEHLSALGAEVHEAPDGVYQYDGVLNGLLVDVKARFDGRWWQQTRWEAAKLKETQERVLYLCIDVMPKTLKIIFRGCVWIDNLRPSGYGCPYAYADDLSDLDFETTDPN